MDTKSNMSLAQLRKIEFKEFETKVDELNGNFPPANIIVAGKTGVGKSTLLNAILKENVAETGIGEPITKEIKKYSCKEAPINIWDTEGLELDSDGKQPKKVFDDIRNVITGQNKNNNNFDKIHCIWYCVNAEAKRFEKIEADFIADLYRIGVPFVIVMTQCFSKKQNDIFQTTIENKLNEINAPNISIIQLLALDKEIEFGDEVKVIPAKGLQQLVDFTIKSMPGYLKNSFIAAQKVDQDSKRKASSKVITEYVICAKEKSFSHKVPIGRILVTNSDAKKMLNAIAKLYSLPMLKKEHIDEICHDSVNAIQKGQFKYFWEKHSKVKKEFDDLTCRMGFNNNDFNFSNIESTDSNRCACLLALYGFKFMNAIEGVWNTSTQEQLEDINKLVALLKAEMNKNYGND